MSPRPTGTLPLNAGRNASDAARIHYCEPEAICGRYEDARCLGGRVEVDGAYEYAKYIVNSRMEYRRLQGHARQHHPLSTAMSYSGLAYGWFVREDSLGCSNRR